MVGNAHFVCFVVINFVSVRFHCFILMKCRAMVKKVGKRWSETNDFVGICSFKTNDFVVIYIFKIDDFVGNSYNKTNDFVGGRQNGF